MSTSIVNRFFLWVCVLLLVTGCGAKKELVIGNLDHNLKVEEVIKRHQKSSPDFKTLRGKIKVDYEDGEKGQGTTLSFRIIKDKGLWLSAPLGMFKALIDKSEVQFYNRLDQEYFEGNFEVISKIIGVSMDFEKVQNLLLGQMIFSSNGKYTMTLDKGYLVQPKKNTLPFLFTASIFPNNFRLISQQILDDNNDINAQINYVYNVTSNNGIPEQIKIEVWDKGIKRTVELEFRNLEIDKTFALPYEVPDGFKKITLSN